MSKLNVLALKAPDRGQETRTFDENGVGFSLTLRTPNAADLALATEEANTLTEDYITGGEFRSAAPFPVADVRVSRSLFLNCAIVAACQVLEGEQERYTAFELTVLSARLPRSWSEISKWVESLVQPWKTEQGK